MKQDRIREDLTSQYFSHTLKEIGDEIGTSPHGVHYILESALKKLNKELAKRNINLQDLL